ncbi:Epoxyqueuosine reductase [Rubripirellula obstinata]|uniref:Epoxyqueuosine reductase n=1 Tax=Rubripirellula obstinata TaxID=406547 RepID=A0A5B1CI11_9BACT|nr:tRNA epoxyqueuosine(34) reductase QueG [Rubripirellula obstinata]KAA1258904.1 Epoxyqueuosine reductase [Rubripirellula obstinata]
MDPNDAASLIREAVYQEGFDLCGIAPAVTSSGYHQLVQWIDAGYAAGMNYFAERRDAYQHPSGVLAGAKSIVVMSFPYPSESENSVSAGHGKIARYAWPGDDYHDVIHPKLKRICRLIKSSFPESNCRGVVDTAPIMEREIAELAGLGWRGKNTLLLNKKRGSYFLLACVLVDIELPADQPHPSDHCGTCTACLDACPTDAFPKPGVLDASRCISYLTIEHRDSIDVELRPKMADWFFGCDVCQEVCPWNRKPSRSPMVKANELATIDLHELFQLDDEQFRERFRKTPLWRTRRRGVLRNAAIVLGNQGSSESLSHLKIGLADEDPLVRGTSAWAIGKIGGDQASSILTTRLSIESDAEVIQEIQQASSALGR